MITQELRHFMGKVSGDISKTTEACTATQENTGKLLENVISQALTKPQDITTPTQPETLECLEETANQILLTKQTGVCPGKQTILAYHNTLTMRHIIYRAFMKHLYLPMLM